VRLIFRHHDEDLAKEHLYIDIMLAEKVAGVIISPTAETDNYSSVLLQAGVPVVAIDRRMCDLNVDTVVVHNVEGAYQAVSHLVELGHRRLGFTGGPSRTTTGRERLEGYEKAMKEKTD
jgi:LacI family transcriptional regulator